MVDSNKIKKMYMEAKSADTTVQSSIINTKSVTCLNTGDVFPSLTAAANWCGLKRASSISDYLKGKTKSAGKHPTTGERLYWAYTDDLED